MVVNRLIESVCFSIGCSAEGACDTRIFEVQFVGDVGQKDILVYFSPEELGRPHPCVLP